jgi:hypothetical protein
MRKALQAFQIARMRKTHAEMLLSPVYGPLCEFFLNDLYGSPHVGVAGVEVFSSLAKVLRGILPGWMYEGAINVVALHDLSAALDDRLARVLTERGITLEFSPAEFEAAYFACDDYADRLRQIALAETATAFAFTLSRHKSVGRLLSLARQFRGLPRVASLLGVLERGHRAFKGAETIAPLLADLREGETKYLDRIYAAFRARARG